MSIRENLEAIRAEIDAAARETGRTGADITLVGASKMNDAAACREAVAAGIDALGENRVQEMVQKLEQHAYDGAPLHFIGHLQRNKVKQVVGHVALIQSVGSLELLDEIEKAHPDVFNILLQVLDDGRLTDNKGRTVDFRNTIIIMTSNLGSQYLLEGINDKGEIEESARQQVLAQLHQQFRPEFLNRLDEIICFKPLTKTELNGIIDILTSALRQRLEDKSLGLEITDSAKQLIIDRGFDPVFGARPLKRYLQSTVETLIARAILAGDMPAGHVIKVDVRDGELVCE